MFGDKLYDSGLVEIINNAIDLAQFEYTPQVRDIIRSELNISDKLVIGHVGRFMKQKNHLFLIDIFKQIHLRDSNTVLLLVGEGDLEQDIKDKVNRLELGGCVFFLGVRTDVHNLFSAMDVFLLPSLYEGLPVVGIEAQASGLRVVAADTITKDAKIVENFIFIPLEQSAQSWAEKALESHTSTRHCRESAINRIIDAGFEIKTAARKLLRFYEGII